VIVRSEIERNLRSLDRRYVNAESAKEALYASKLAVMELGGWIELSMDDIIERCAIRHLSVEKNRKFCEEKIVGLTWGFEYEKHFRSMLMRLIGLINVERIERSMDGAVHSAFLASLGSIRNARDSEAHTYLKGVTRAIDAPSVTLVHYSRIERGLSQIDDAIRRRRW
jgi:hypothetical protein